ITSMASVNLTVHAKARTETIFGQSRTSAEGDDTQSFGSATYKIISTSEEGVSVNFSQQSSSNNGSRAAKYSATRCCPAEKSNRDDINLLKMLCRCRIAIWSQSLAWQA
ncbi:MAG: hypothetical protein ACREF7_04840, partial [Candidatus Saccharimonadales bacterium]